jgi:hypothetical protein
VEGLQNLDQSVEILIRLLCAIPGWNEKNVQVFKCFWCFTFLYEQIDFKLNSVMVIILRNTIKSAGSATGHWSHYLPSFNCIKISEEMCSALPFRWVLSAICLFFCLKLELYFVKDCLYFFYKCEPSQFCAKLIFPF